MALVVNSLPVCRIFLCRGSQPRCLENPCGCRKLLKRECCDKIQRKVEKHLLGYCISHICVSSPVVPKLFWFADHYHNLIEESFGGKFSLKKRDVGSVKLLGDANQFGS